MISPVHCSPAHVPVSVLIDGVVPIPVGGGDLSQRLVLVEKVTESNLPQILHRVPSLAKLLFYRTLQNRTGLADACGLGLGVQSREDARRAEFLLDRLGECLEREVRVLVRAHENQPGVVAGVPLALGARRSEEANKGPEEPLAVESRQTDGEIRLGASLPERDVGQDRVEQEVQVGRVDRMRLGSQESDGSGAVQEDDVE